MKMRLSNFRNNFNTGSSVLKMLSNSTIKLLPILIMAIVVTPQVKAQIIFQEHFTNVTTVAYGTSIQPSTFDGLFDNIGWTSSSSSGQSCAEAGSLCLGKNGSSGGTLTTKAMDLSGSDPITLSFKLKYYGTNSITGSTSSKISVTLDGTTIFSGVKGVVSIPTGQPNYTASDWTTYTFTITGGTATSKIAFVGTSSNYAIMFDDVVVTRIPSSPVTLTTTTANPVAYTTATTGGSITSSNISSISERGIVWSTSPNPIIGAAGTTTVSENPLTTTADFSINLTGLTPGITYYFKAYAINNYNGSTTSYGDEKSFTTKSLTTPTVTTTPYSNLTSFGALTGGNVSDDGGSTVTARGVVWSTSPNPTVPSVNSTSDGTGTGTYPSQITGLAASTTYYVRAYATNTNGTSYGDPISFTTDAPQPALVASVTNLIFPATTIGSSYTLTYTLTGTTLDGTPVAIAVPAGFTVSPDTIRYTGNTFSQLITVVFTPAAWGTYSGAVSQTGGGATSAYTVSPTLSGSGKLPPPSKTSNAGNDFWLGFGFHDGMAKNTAKLAVYVAAGDKATTAVVEMPGISGFTTLNIPIPANQVTEISPDAIPGFVWPTGDGVKGGGGGNSSYYYNFTNAGDARLFKTGVTSNAIHVYTADGNDVSVWMYTYYTDNSAAGSMIFPTNTWNTSYTVQAYGNNSNSGVPSSFFYAIADEDDTHIEFTPSVDILDAATGNLFTSTPTGTVKYSAGVTYDTIINKGQVFNAMGIFASKYGQDLSGTTIKTTDCKKIAVFGGNGRCLVDVGDGVTPQKYGNTGSDNLVQQMFPMVAWGTKYYTVPTKHMEYNLYRVVVDDPATQVWVNDPTHSNPLTGLTNHFYQFSTNQPSIIESDKHISVTQYIASQGYASGHTSYGSASDYGMNGIGDPEMIILSPAQQAINKATVYSPSFKNGNANNTFITSDGRTIVEAGAFINVVIPKSGLASFRLDTATNITQMVDTGSSSYNGIPFDSSAAIPIINAFKPYDLDSNYYWAKFKVAYPAPHVLQSDVPFNAIAYGCDDGESYGFNAGTQVNDLSAPLIINNPYGDSLNSLNQSKPLTTCKGTEVVLSAVLPIQNVEGHNIIISYRNNPNISPNTNDTLVNPGSFTTFKYENHDFFIYKIPQKHIFNAVGDFPIDVTYFNPVSSGDACGEQGSNKTLSFSIKVTEGIAPDFSIKYNTCKSDTVYVTDKSNGLGYDLIKWKWNTSGSVALPNNQDTVQNPKFKNPTGNTSLSLRAINSIGCYSDLTKVLPVTTPAVANFGALPTGVCSSASAKFKLDSLASGTPSGGKGVFSGTGVVKEGLYYYFDPSSSGVSTTSPNTITYTYTSLDSCVDVKTQTISITKANTLTLNSVSPLCVNANAVTLVTNNVVGGVISGNGVTNGVFNPATAGVGTHTITYSIPNNNCSTPATIQIQVVDLPAVSFGSEFANLCTNSSAIQLNQGSPAGGVYSGNGIVNGSFNPAASGVSTSAPNVITYTVTNSTGCVKSATNSIIVNPLPSVSAGPDVSVVESIPATITGTGPANAQYLWSSYDGLPNASSLSTEVQVSVIGLYHYVLTGTLNGCSASDTMLLTVKSALPCLDPMKGFTPNNDGFNDVWKIFRDGSCFVRVQVDVYNRWGGRVYHSDDYHNDWGGTWDGKAIPDGTYYFVIRPTDATGHTNTLTGNVTIIR